MIKPLWWSHLINIANIDLLLLECARGLQCALPMHEGWIWVCNTIQNGATNLAFPMQNTFYSNIGHTTRKARWKVGAPDVAFKYNTSIYIYIYIFCYIHRRGGEGSTLLPTASGVQTGCKPHCTESTPRLQTGGSPNKLHASKHAFPIHDSHHVAISKVGVNKNPSSLQIGQEKALINFPT